jgi:hypothetical protein
VTGIQKNLQCAEVLKYTLLVPFLRTLLPSHAGYDMQTTSNEKSTRMKKSQKKTRFVENKAQINHLPPPNFPQPPPTDVMTA